MPPLSRSTGQGPTIWCSYPTRAVLARELPATPHLQGDTPWDVEPKGQGFLESLLPMWPTTLVPMQSAPPKFPWVPVKNTG